MSPRAARGPVKAPPRTAAWPDKPRSLDRIMSDPMLRCLGSRRHLFESGVTYQEIVNGLTVWVARLVCDRCGSVRVTMYEPHPGWVVLSAHRYFRPAEYEALMESYDADAARQVMLNALWDEAKGAAPRPRQRKEGAA